jgi:hypothetical protein
MRPHKESRARFFGGAAVAVLFAALASLLLSPREFPTGEPHGPKIPVAKIQLVPDQKGQCRHLVFHNDSGRFEQSGTGRCKGLSADEADAEMARENRTNAMARVFKSR